MTAPAVLVYTGNPCQDWLTDALQYGITYANEKHPTCRDGVPQSQSSPLYVPPAQLPTPGAPPAPVAIPTGCSSCGSSPAQLAAVATGGVGAVVPRKATGFPWWVAVLALMILAAIVGGKPEVVYGGR
jgi:hypothetical protein